MGAREVRASGRDLSAGAEDPGGAELAEAAQGLLATVFPVAKGIRLLGVTLSSLEAREGDGTAAGAMAGRHGRR